MDSTFRNELKTRGLRFTSQREAVLDVIIENDGKHLSSEEIYELVKAKIPEIGIATVYRTLILLEDMGIINKVDLDDGKGRYEINRSKEEHLHHHLICLKCGSVLEVKYDLLEHLEEQILDETGFIVKNHSVKLYGYCKECAEEAKGKVN